MAALVSFVMRSILVSFSLVRMSTFSLHSCVRSSIFDLCSLWRDSVLAVLVLLVCNVDSWWTDAAASVRN